jgi:S-DNA-T family DNA segregation ATPase FtsK/SpoIIIE
MASVGFIAGLAGASFALVSLLTFSTSDPSWSSSGAGDVLSNQGGVVGAYFSDMVYSLVGFLALGVPLLLLLLSYRSIRPAVIRGVTSTDRVISSFGWVTFLAASAGLIQIVVPQEAFLPQGTGGIIGYGVASWFTAAFSDFGARLLLSFCVLLGGTLAFDIDWMRVAEKVGSVTINTMNTLRSRIDDFNDRRKLRTEKAKRSVQIAAHVEKEKLRTPPKIKAPKLLENVGKKAEREKQKPLFESAELTPMPPLALLDAPTQTGPRGYSTSELESLSRLLEIKLADFGITAEVVSVYPGPVVTRFEIQPAAGVKVSRISNLAKDLARSLAVNSVRVVEVIHGKSVVGIEIPNADRQTVNFRDVLSSAEFDDAKSPLTIALGHDIAGTPIVADLGKMPHVLVAGTTGSNSRSTMVFRTSLPR